MTVFFIIIGITLGMFFIVLLLQSVGFNPGDNPNDPRSEWEKRR